MVVSTCSVGDCEADATRRGWCKKHYSRWRTTGDPTRTKFGTPTERFWAKVDKDGLVPPNRPDLGPCWVWTRSRYQSGLGYGAFVAAGRRVNAMRFAYEEAYGPLPKGWEPDHLCLNVRCVRPSHLEGVTHQENMRRHFAQKTHCMNGHAYPETRLGQRGGYRCPICYQAAVQRKRAVLHAVDR